MSANTAENAACTARDSAVQDISCTFLFAPRSSGDTRDTVIGTTVKMEMAVFALSLVQSPASLVRSKSIEKISGFGVCNATEPRAVVRDELNLDGTLARGPRSQLIMTPLM
jgi:hypothetical protein